MVNTEQTVGMGANRRGAAKPGLVPTHLTLGKWQEDWFEMFLSKLDLLRKKGASVLRAHVLCPPIGQVGSPAEQHQSLGVRKTLEIWRRVEAPEGEVRSGSQKGQCFSSRW